MFREEVFAARGTRVHGSIIIRQPMTVTLLTSFLFVIVVTCLIFAATSSYARSENVRGIISTSVPTARISAIRPGVIGNLLVREGQTVDKGDRLAVIDVDTRLSGGGALAAQSLGLLMAQRGMADERRKNATARYLAQRNMITAQISSLESQASQLAASQDIQERLVESSKRIVDRARTVLERGFVSQMDFERREQAEMQARQSLASLKREGLALGSQIRQSTLSLNTLTADYDKEIGTLLVADSDLEQQRLSTEGARSYTLTAPVDGTVTAIQAQTGQPVQTSYSLLTIVPPKTKLVVDLYAQTSAVGFIQRGQKVNLMIDAFPYQKFGSFTGTVEYVSATITDPKDANIPIRMDEPFFRIRVSLPNVRRNATSLHLQPGLTLTGNIILERRTFLEWLMSPLYAIAKRNGQ